MSRRFPISVFIIAKDEADRIGASIASVRDWVDEVLVIDSGSHDDTISIAGALGARVIAHAWEGYGPQKRFAERQCRHDWLLNLDADESVDAALAQAIQAEFTHGAPECAAFEMRWKLVHWGDERPRPLAAGGRFVRLYDRRRAGFRDSIVHDSVAVHEGPVRQLRGCIWHKSFRSFEHFRTKLSEYAEWQARDLRAHGRCPGRRRVWIEPWVAFCRLYFRRRYWVYGADGVRMALSYAAARKRRLTLARRLFGNGADRAGAT
jgi:glycosyltransferase involved in cell wall biosynthesis